MTSFLSFPKGLLAAGAMSLNLGWGAHAAPAEPLELYVDADYSISSAAALAIEQGVRTALAEVDYMVAGHRIDVIPMDHRGNAKRSKHNMKRYLASETAIAMIGGLHSPPYLTHKNYINESGILMLLPWSAAGPITRAKPGTQNWIFRLSVDDFQSGSFLVREAVDHGGCESVALVLLDSGWGRANHATLTEALAERGQGPSIVEFFSTGVGPASVRTLAENVARAQSDCAIMLANWDDGASLVNALHARGTDIRIFSHWGIMGGSFTELVSHEVRESLQISVLQTCILRSEQEGSAILDAALERGAPGVASIAELPAPTGFAHGYDLTRIFIAAMEQAAQSGDWGGDMLAKRAALRAALQTLNVEVAGILGVYDPPFQAYSADRPDAHEALGFDDLCMARFRHDGFLEHAG